MNSVHGYLCGLDQRTRDPFLERPGNLTGPESDFDIKVSRKVGRVLTSDEVHFVSLADNFTAQFSNLLKLPPGWKTKQLNGPGNYRELRETFLERPGNLTGLGSDFVIKVSRKVGRVLTSDEVHFVSLADNFTVQVSNLLKLPLEWKTKHLNGPGNYREHRETGPWVLVFLRPN